MSHHRSRPHRPGPHELGQNLLVDRHTIDRIVALVGARPRRRPVVEWAAGRGALTTRLATLGRPLEAVEVDPRSIRALRRAVPPHCLRWLAVRVCTRWATSMFLPPFY